MTTIAPAVLLRRGSATCTTRATETRLVSTMSPSSSRSWSLQVRRGAFIPAASTRPSRRLHLRSIAEALSVTSSTLRTTPGRASTSAPNASASRATALTRSGRRPLNATRHPLDAADKADARPMPLPPPVTHSTGRRCSAWSSAVSSCMLSLSSNPGEVRSNEVEGAPMLVDVTGKVVLVTGGGRGIGRVLTERFGSEGSRVVALDVAFGDESAPDYDLLRCDVSDHGSVQHAVGE